MEIEATIVGTQEGRYLACIDQEKAMMNCGKNCPVCDRPSRALLEKDQPLEKGRRVLADIKVPFFEQKGKLYGATAFIYAIFFIFILLIIKSQLPYYRGILPPFLGGFFSAATFYLLQKSLFEKKGGGKRLRRGRIIRAFPPENA